MKLTPEQLKERWKWIEYWQKWERQHAAELTAIDARHWPDGDEFIEVVVRPETFQPDKPRDRALFKLDIAARDMRSEDWWLEPPARCVGYNGEAYAPHVYGAVNEVSGEFIAR